MEAEKKNGIKTADLVLAAGKVGIAAAPLILNPASPLYALLAVGATEAVSLYWTEDKKERANQVFGKFRKWFYSLPSDEQIEIQERVIQSSTEYSNLFEEAEEAAMKAKGANKLRAISNVLFYGVSTDGNQTQARMYLSIIGFLEDLDLAILLEAQRKRILLEKETEKIRKKSGARFGGTGIDASGFDVGFNDLIRIGGTLYGANTEELVRKMNINGEITMMVERSVSRLKSQNLILERRGVSDNILGNHTSLMIQPLALRTLNFFEDE